MNREELKKYLGKFSYLDLRYLLEILQKIPECERNDVYNDLCELCDYSMEHYFEDCIYVTKDDLRVKNKDFKWDRCSISKVFNCLDYKELKYTRTIFRILCKYEDKNSEYYEEYDYLLKILTRLINKKILYVTEVLDINELTLEEFYIFFDTIILDSNSGDRWGMCCDVAASELTPEIMYKTFHKEPKVLRRVR